MAVAAWQRPRPAMPPLPQPSSSWWPPTLRSPEPACAPERHTPRLSPAAVGGGKALTVAAACTLAEALRRRQQHQSVGRLCLTWQGITSLLDDGAEPCASLQHSCATLLLTHNELSSLEGLSTGFDTLVQLSLGTNRLPSLASSLAELRRLPKLRVLTLEGNPLTSERGYRDRVLLALPNLLNLDGR
jgi:hypothetical protein